MLTPNAERFLAAYQPLLQAAVEKDIVEHFIGDRQYALNRDDTAESYSARVARRMVERMVEGVDVNVSDNMRKAAKRCGLPNTRMKTIFDFVRQT